MSRAPRATPAWWYGTAPVPMWAALLERVFAPLARARRESYASGRLKSTRVGVPVIVIGNLTAGGTGKTPLVIALVDHLKKAGHVPGIATRGHGRNDERTAQWSEPGSDAAHVGDEPALLARETGVRVRVDRDRVAAARALVDAGCTVVVCDDGLQHLALQRDLEIEVIDAARGYGNGRLMPAGPLREPPGRAVDLRVVNMGLRADAPPLADDTWPMHLEGATAHPLQSGREKPLSAFAGQRVHAVAGIGNPDRFFDLLRAAGIAIVPHAFPDHHPFTAADFAFSSHLPVLMTSKDAVKCTAFAREDWYSVPVQAMLPESFWAALDARLPSTGPIDDPADNPPHDPA